METRVMGTHKWDVLSDWQVRAYRQACVDLLAYYKGEADDNLKKRVERRDPLCRADFIPGIFLGGCYACPFRVLEGGDCDLLIDLDFVPESRRGIAKEVVPMLERWIPQIDAYIKARQSVPFFRAFFRLLRNA